MLCAEGLGGGKHLVNRRRRPVRFEKQRRPLFQAEPLEAVECGDGPVVEELDRRQVHPVAHHVRDGGDGGFFRGEGERALFAPLRQSD
jgi:hypothetical protein